MSEDKEAIANSSQESTQEILKKILKKIHENGEGRSVYDLGNPALIAGTFDYLRLESGAFKNLRGSHSHLSQKSLYT